MRSVSFLDYEGSLYQSLATSHGSTLMYIVAPIVLFIAFFSLAVLSTTTFNFRLGGVFLMLVIMGCFGFTPIHTGWTFYTPLSILYESFLGFDFVLMSVIMLSFLVCSVSISLLSCMNSDVDRKRPTISTISVGSWMVIILFPVLIVINIMLVLDRLVGSSFFSEPVGDSIVFQTGFWIFGHPEVYLLTLPVLGILVSMPTVLPVAVSTYCVKRSLVGILVSRVAFLSTIVWGHHMLSTNMDVFFKVFFILASAYIAIPMFNSIRFAVSSNACTSTRSFGVSNSPNQVTQQSIYTSILVPICAAGFILGGVTTILFFFSSSASSVHGSRFVVGHFHLFFVVFVIPLLAFIRIRTGSMLFFKAGFEQTAFGSFPLAMLGFVGLSLTSAGTVGGSRRALLINSVLETRTLFQSVVLFTVAAVLLYIIIPVNYRGGLESVKIRN